MARAFPQRGKQLLARILLGAVLVLPYSVTPINISLAFISSLLVASLLLIAWSRYSFYFLAVVALLVSLLQLIYTLYAGKLIDEYYWIASVSANKNEALSFIESLQPFEIFIYVCYLSIAFVLMRLSVGKRFYIFDLIGKSIFIFIALGFSAYYGSELHSELPKLKLFPMYIANSFLMEIATLIN
jgi:hypothetical protein